MKKWMFVLVILMAWLPLFMGSFRGRGTMEIVPVYSSMPGSEWKELGTITASHATFVVASRDYSTVNDADSTEIVTWDIPDDADNIELRFQTDANGDDHIVELWFARGATCAGSTTEDSYTLTHILTLEGGTQVGPNSNVFCDDTIETQDYGNYGERVEAASGNRIGRYIITKLRGYKKMAVIATTLETSTTLYIDGAWYSYED